MLRPFVILSALSTFCIAAIVDSIDDLKERKYDFVVVGGGTAGNVIANRLTEHPDISVLVLEAGGSNEDVLVSEVPFLCTRATPNTPYDWNFTTIPQSGLNGRSIPYARGHILGGSSSVNFMAYTRGSSEDFDRFAKITKDEGWSWDRLQPYIRKNERFGAPADHHNVSGQFDPAVHGFQGVNSVTLPGFSQATDSRVIQTTEELSEEFPFNLDANSGSPLGIGWEQTTIRDGARSSSATSYLAPKFTRRPNLHVLLHAQVTKLLQTQSTSRVPAFRDVEFVQKIGGPVYLVTARKEVILSAGVIGTPHILMLSGIGDATELSSHGIKPLHNLLSVGKNLTDHPLLGNAWLVNGTSTFETITRNATFLDEDLQRWNTTHTGPLVDNPSSQIGWLRIPDNATIFNTYVDPAAGPNTPHFELLFANGFSLGPPPPTGNYMSISSALVAPLSRGFVSLNSSNPFDHPLINPNFFESPFDMFVMREAVRSARRFLTAPVWNDYILSPLNNDNTDAELDLHIRNNSVTLNHPVGTAAMTAKDSTWGVVDPDLRVKGVEGLRIVDASVFPRIPGAHTQAATYIVAERAADLIKG